MCVGCSIWSVGQPSPMGLSLDTPKQNGSVIQFHQKKVTTMTTLTTFMSTVLPILRTIV